MTFVVRSTFQRDASTACIASATVATQNSTYSTQLSACSADK